MCVCVNDIYIYIYLAGTRTHITCLAIEGAARKEAAFYHEEHGWGSVESGCAGIHWVKLKPVGPITVLGHTMSYLSVPWLSYICIYMHITHHSHTHTHTYIYICIYIYTHTLFIYLVLLYHTTIMTASAQLLTHAKLMADCGLLVGAREQWWEIRESVQSRGPTAVAMNSVSI